MNGNEPHVSGTGPTKSQHAVGRSGASLDHAGQRRDLWGDVRGEDEGGSEDDGPGLPHVRYSPGDMNETAARRIDRAASETDRSRAEIAEAFGVCESTVSYITNRQGKYADMLGEDERTTTERMSDANRKYDPEQIREAYRLAHADNDLSYCDIAERVGFGGKSIVGRIKRGEAHQHITEEMEL